MQNTPLPPWYLVPHLPRQELDFFEHVGVPRVQAQLLYNRGIQAIGDMKHCISGDFTATGDPMDLVDMQRAVERIGRACLDREHISVYGDYDADGVTSAAVLYRGVRRLQLPGGVLDAYIPHRLTEGFGLHKTAIEQLYKRGTSLIITCDCGTADTSAVEFARSLGMDVIITDHHHPSSPLPRAYALVNPWRLEASERLTHGERNLSGVGVAFKLVQALFRDSETCTLEDERALLDLVAVGTIADVVPLLGDNHIFVREGLAILNEAGTLGLRVLIAVADMRRWGKLRERDIAFGIAPRLNAAGRMQDASLAFSLLTTDDPREASTLVETLQQLNSSRRSLTDTLVPLARRQAREQHDSPVLLLRGEGWHEGIIGLVAGKLAEETGKPVAVVSTDQNTQLCKGSARAPAKYNLMTALDGFADSLERYGGHAQAAGFTVRYSQLEALHEHLVSVAATSPQHDETAFSDSHEQKRGIGEEELGRIRVDFQISRAESLNSEFYQLVHDLAPFGQSFPEPTFLLKGLCILDYQHHSPHRTFLRFAASRGNWQVTGTFAGDESLLEELRSTSTVTIVFQLETPRNTFPWEARVKILHIECGEL